MDRALLARRSSTHAATTRPIDTRAQRHLTIVHAAVPAVARAVRQVGTIPRRAQLTTILREAVPTSPG